VAPVVGRRELEWMGESAFDAAWLSLQTRAAHFLPVIGLPDRATCSRNVLSRLPSAARETGGASWRRRWLNLKVQNAECALHVDEIAKYVSRSLGAQLFLPEL
jgi:hypothetical protein